MDGHARSKVGYGRETGGNILSSRFTAHDPFRLFASATGNGARGWFAHPIWKLRHHPVANLRASLTLRSWSNGWFPNRAPCPGVTCYR
jgi:hypothetical protein